MGGNVGRLRHSSPALATPQIVARAGLGRVTVARQLATLEAAGAIGRIAGRPQRWYWRGAAAEAAASEGRQPILNRALVGWYGRGGEWYTGVSSDGASPAIGVRIVPAAPCFDRAGTGDDGPA